MTAAGEDRVLRLVCYAIGLAAWSPTLWGWWRGLRDAKKAGLR